MTQSTTNFSRGDVVIVPFAFSDRRAFKNRPALILSSDRYHSSRQELIIAAITSRIRQPPLTGDHVIQGWRESGLPRPSVVTAILRTAKSYHVVRKMGVLPPDDMAGVEAGLREALAL
jgi:mRNA interferase MazF